MKTFSVSMAVVLAVVVGINLAGCPRPNGGGNGGSGFLDAQLVAEGLELPVFVTSFPDDASRLLALEQRSGQIVLIQDGAKQDTPFLDIDDKVIDSGYERGLFSMAFHPDFATNGRFYVAYSDNSGATVVEEYLVSDDPNVADASSGIVLLQVSQPHANHNGGMLAFGSDGFLYLGLGDGGGANDLGNNAQNLETLLGKMVRMDVDAPDLVPDDNPFVNEEGADPLIWAYGLRNPWRFSFDSATGDLYIGDAGQTAREEIDVQPASSTGGENYGWRIAEGFACRGGTGSCGTDEGFTPPVHEYGRRLAPRAVTGGYVYRGEAIPELEGLYFFGDFETSQIWTFRFTGDGIEALTERTADLGEFSGISSFGEDADGELYIVDHGGGAVYRIVAEAEAEGDGAG